MRLQELYEQAKKHDRAQICRFMRDMKKAGLKIRYYQGRFFWKGPSVTTDDIQEVLSNTKVPCQWDNMGLSKIVYPRQSL
jgi:hypothetical protein